MIGNKRVLAVIPARGGSKRLPKKNVLPLNGKPLIAWTINAALDAQAVDRVVVTTDCAEIAIVAKQYGADVPFLRPAHLSDDTASTNDVLLHLVGSLVDDDFDILVVLQPTSPLRTSQDIDEALQRFESDTVDGVVSVCECEHSPMWSNVLPESQHLGAFIRSEVVKKRSQDLPQYYRLNGAVYAFCKEAFIEAGGIHYSDRVFAHCMPIAHSIDIDHQLDFQLAEFMLQNT